jgi:3-phosphoshikimate 1-carboxyvinyltransferase
MDVLIQAGDRLAGEVDIPSSKSYGQRALAASLLVSKARINNLGKSADELAVLEVLRTCGSQVSMLGTGNVEIETRFDFNKNIKIDCGESGLAARLFAGLLMLNHGETIIVGQGSLNLRPMTPLFSIFSQLGIESESANHYLPIRYKGKLFPIDLQADGGLSSQFITGLLYYMVGLKHHSPLSLLISNIKSKPYLDMTMQMLSEIGADLEWKGQEIIVKPSALKSEVELNVEADWSSASFWIVAAAISGRVKLNGLNRNSLQADVMLLEVIQSYGADVLWQENQLVIQSSQNRSFRVDANHAPDLIPILVVLAIFAEGKSIIKGVNRLKFKESDRLNGILKWLAMLKIPHNLEGDDLTIVGKSKINYHIEPLAYSDFEGENDHRMVMASSILALFLNGGKLKGTTSIQKSYPDFFLDFEKLGGRLIC